MLCYEIGAVRCGVGWTVLSGYFDFMCIYHFHFHFHLLSYESCTAFVLPFFLFPLSLFTFVQTNTVGLSLFAFGKQPNTVNGFVYNCMSFVDYFYWMTIACSGSNRNAMLYICSFKYCLILTPIDLSLSLTHHTLFFSSSILTLLICRTIKSILKHIDTQNSKPYIFSIGSVKRFYSNLQIDIDNKFSRWQNERYIAHQF